MWSKEEDDGWGSLSDLYVEIVYCNFDFTFLMPDTYIAFLGVRVNGACLKAWWFGLDLVGGCAYA